MLRILLYIVSSLLLVIDAAAQTLSVTRITINYRDNPVGVETEQPLFGWELSSKTRGAAQTAYQVFVARTKAELLQDRGTIWDSKKQQGTSSVGIRYEGPALKANSRYFWKVKVWDANNKVSSSAVGEWQMGLLTASDWKGAQWIAYEKMPDSLLDVLPADNKKDRTKENNIQPLLRREFSVKKTIRMATAYVSGLGQFELHVNGKKIGDHFLDPGWTKYDKQALYVPFDITKELKTGANAIGVMLGNGFYYIPPVSGRYRKLRTAFGYPKMIGIIILEYSDGTSESIVTDKNWNAAPGPITFSSIYGGEDYDATKEIKGWDAPSFPASGWKAAVIVDGPQNLNSQDEEPLKPMQSFSPVSITDLGVKGQLYDFGQNASAIIRIKLKVAKGDTIRFWPGELLKNDKTVNQKASGGPYFFQYIAKGNGEEEWEPRFSYYGFRYVQVVIAPANARESAATVAKVIELTSKHIRNAAPTVGHFSSSNELFNKTHELVDWAIRSNMVSVFTDCPHREKLGWLEQVHLMGNSVRYRYDAMPLFVKNLDDMRHSQLDNGLIPEIAPEYVQFLWGDGMFRDSPEWGSSCIISPWYLYQWYGDTTVLSKNYEMMRRYLDYLQTKEKNGILSQGLGDWYDLGPKPPGISQLTPMGVTATAIYHYDLDILSKIAGLLEKGEDSIRFAAKAMQVRKAFNDSFYHAETEQYGGGSQTANAMALYMDLVPGQDRTTVLANLVADVEAKGLTAGDIGYRYLLQVLLHEGRSDVIFKMNNRADIPGYGYQIAKGATALTESWAALPTNSNNHFMLGHIMEWFYEGLLGIVQAPGSVAFSTIQIKPQVVGDLQWAKGSYHSVRGEIKVAWKKETGKFNMDISVPANTSAEVYLPATGIGSIFTDGKPVKGQRYIKDRGKTTDGYRLLVASGSYSFEVKQ